MRRVFSIACVLAFAAIGVNAADDRVAVPGKNGPGKGRRIVLVSGDEEYRSEQALPQLARILAEHHGFDCTVLFAIDPQDGAINPNYTGNIPGLETLDSADLLVLFTRFRDLPDTQMKHFVDYLAAGKPIVAIRTATHAFDLKTSQTYQRFSWNSKEWDGGFGRQILGETWINHHGRHGVQSTRGIVAQGQERNPILRGIPSGGIWVPTDVYEVRLPLRDDVQPLIFGEVLEGMRPSDPPVAGKANDPMMPVAWTKTYAGGQGRNGRVFTTTMGSAQDLLNEAFRRLLVNASYWALGMESRIPARADVGLVGAYHPLPFQFGGFAKGVKPADLAAR
ncbi:Signal peptide and transmembrane prediction [Candidatus Sulfopaludibacter sp. SbA6]|nr:Signal peptide and transmembrane prediction [Candidatus Sulfopaludibacter sp. SbA6]